MFSKFLDFIGLSIMTNGVKWTALTLFLSLLVLHGMGCPVYGAEKAGLVARAGQHS